MTLPENVPGRWAAAEEEVKRLQQQLSDCTLAREQLAAEVERLREEPPGLAALSEALCSIGDQDLSLADEWMQRATAAEAALAEAVKERDKLRKQTQNFLVWLTGLFPGKTVWMGSENRKYTIILSTEQANRFEADWTKLCKAIRALKDSQC